MRRGGRIPDLTLHTYVLTAGEVARLYFRRSPEFLESAEFKAKNPTFPKPRVDGLFHRASVEAWVDSTFGIIGQAPATDYRALAMEAAKRGPRQNATRQA